MQVNNSISWIDEIKSLRDERGYSDAEIAAELGMSKQFMSDILLGKVPVSLKLKVKIWARRAYDLDRDRALAFLPEKVAEDLVARDQERGRQRAAAMVRRANGDDWLDDLVAIRDERRWTNVELAADLGVSKQYISAVLSRSKPITWSLKAKIWGRRNYDLSRDTLMGFLPDEVSKELIDLDRRRGRTRAARLAASRERDAQG